jgi:hypothetical protein
MNEWRMKASNQSNEANRPIPMQVDSFVPAHSAFGLPIYVALLPAGSTQRVCHDTLPWLISFSLGLCKEHFSEMEQLGA